MKWIWNRCRRRQDVSLLAGGALGEEEKIELENHLAVCQECRVYFKEIKALTAPLAGWEKNLAPIEATPRARLRWARAVQEAALHSSTPNPGRLRLGTRVWQVVWRELIRPSRYAWGSMAAIWVVMLAVNGQLSDHRMIEASDHSSSARDMMMAWVEQNRVLAELTQPAFGFTMPATPAILPRPHSERERDRAII
jgi:hypothetical protein